MKKELSETMKTNISVFIKHMLYKYNDTDDLGYKKVILLITQLIKALYNNNVEVINTSVFINNINIENKNYVSSDKLIMDDKEIKIISTHLFLLMRNTNDAHEQVLLNNNEYKQQIALTNRHYNSLVLTCLIQFLNLIYDYDIKVNINIDDFYTSFILNDYYKVEII